MKCPRCGNDDDNAFYQGSRGVYCRRCIKFSRLLLEERIEEKGIFQISGNADYELSFRLTQYQQNCIKQLKMQLQQQSEVVLYAACGAGKTEMVLDVIQRALVNHQRVGFAVARRQVVLELGKRFRHIFKNLKVTTVCQGYTTDTEGDLIVCTTHQLYRYPQTFHLLILDEPDAYPFKGNALLQAIARYSCVGKTIYLTATPDKQLRQLPQVTLFKRPHGYPIPVPQCCVVPKWFDWILLIQFIKKHRKCLIFVPTIQLAKYLSFILCKPCLHSQTSNKEMIIKQFEEDEIRCLICTTILERGVTFKGIDVCVFQAHHRVFDLASLIQISGRVGRHPQYPTGTVFFLANQRKETLEQCIQTIQMMNA